MLLMPRSLSVDTKAHFFKLMCLPSCRYMLDLMELTCKVFRRVWTGMCLREAGRCLWTPFRAYIRHLTMATHRLLRRAKGKWMLGEAELAHYGVGAMLT